MEFEPYKINLDLTLPPEKRLITINNIEYTLNENDYHATKAGEIVSMCINGEWYQFKERESYQDNADYWTKIISHVQKNPEDAGLLVSATAAGYDFYKNYVNGNEKEKERAVARLIVSLAGSGILYGGKKIVKHFRRKVDQGYQGSASGKILVKRDRPYYLFETRLTYY